MKFIDLHCDTLMQAYLSGIENLYQMPGMLDIERMRKAGQWAQFFAIFMPPIDGLSHYEKEGQYDDEAYIESCLKIFYYSMESHPDIIGLALNGLDIRRNRDQGKMSGLLTLEDGRSVKGSLEKIRYYYDKGVRLITLTWNHENCFAYPNSFDSEVMGKGLKEFGKEAVEYMNHLGMIIDVSHLSDGGFWDVVKVSKQPFLASHSNARALSPHPRNLTDDMIHALAEAGGVVGLNFCPAFVNQDIHNENTQVVDLVDQIDYLVNKGGIDLVALGSDFDGIGGSHEVQDPMDMHLIFEALDRRGYSDDAIEQIAWRNALRFIDEVL